MHADETYLKETQKHSAITRERNNFKNNTENSPAIITHVQANIKTNIQKHPVITFVRTIVRQKECLDNPLRVTPNNGKYQNPKSKTMKIPQNPKISCCGFLQHLKTANLYNSETSMFEMFG